MIGVVLLPVWTIGDEKIVVRVKINLLSSINEIIIFKPLSNH